MSKPVFEYEEQTFADNSLECTFHNGVLNVRVENPWAGDTASGFGATCYVSMDVAKAHELGKWLLSLNVCPSDS